MSNVIPIFKNKEKKDLETSLADGRTPLFVSHLDGKVKGSPHLKRPPEDFGDRIQRIRTSLEKINSLMAELRQQNGRKSYDSE